MYCPKCSQQQVSDEVRFCSRCGFPLTAVRELIATGGALTEREAEAVQLSPAFRGMRKGVWVMLACLPLALVAGLLAAMDDVFAVLLLLPVFCFVAGFALLLYGTFIQSKSPQGKRDSSQSVKPVMPAQLSTAPRSPELLPARVPPIEGFADQRIVTAEMVEQPSVTENTTRSLKEKVDSRRG